ncbi:unnamed protein product [Parascedosporium putredinis]|uniref:Uncharacterized protein n=1 Tax=Parascedosporium putredinis TaxID=1442378 RepID=A0A9P1H3A8_9PEZI|nr:unnamed protein product [Parascedosporium putredinis]CAI7994649.1 unnamed protein product [Parascedosporium putredinis]
MFGIALPSMVFPEPHVAGASSAEADPASSGTPCGLVRTLQAICRPGDINQVAFESLGIKTYYDATLAEVIPDPTYIPDFSTWDTLTTDVLRETNASTRLPLNNGNLSPGCQTYAERKAELSISNADAFRTVRRLPPAKGKPHVRLGNSYEFFRCLELFTSYWDDPTAPPPEPVQVEPTPETAAQGEEASGAAPPPQSDDAAYYRTTTGSSMPAEHRHSLLSAFIRLVAYDFGCNVTTPRTEPRLTLCTPKTGAPRGQQTRKSYVPSGCIFVFRTPSKREHARAGMVEGPVAAVSARGTINLDVELEKNQDLAREGQWWTTKKRWGGGSGGPIGRELDGDDMLGDKDSTSPPMKKPRKTMAVYDNYRMVRPPAFSWDKKTRYEAIGRPSGGADYDDIFVISSLFHHVSVLRLRVPKRLLEVLDGADEDTAKSWGDLVLWRSKWYDFFKEEERIQAVQLLWSLFSYQMRKSDGEDTAMAG